MTSVQWCEVFIVDVCVFRFFYDFLYVIICCFCVCSASMFVLYDVMWTVIMAVFCGLFLPT